VTAGFEGHNAASQRPISRSVMQLPVAPRKVRWVFYPDPFSTELPRGMGNWMMFFRPPECVSGTSGFRLLCTYLYRRLWENPSSRVGTRAMGFLVRLCGRRVEIGLPRPHCPPAIPFLLRISRQASGEGSSTGDRAPKPSKLLGVGLSVVLGLVPPILLRFDFFVGSFGASFRLSELVQPWIEDHYQFE